GLPRFFNGVIQVALIDDLKQTQMGLKKVRLHRGCLRECLSGILPLVLRHEFLSKIVVRLSRPRVFRDRFLKLFDRSGGVPHFFVESAYMIMDVRKLWVEL